MLINDVRRGKDKNLFLAELKFSQEKSAEKYMPFKKCGQIADMKDKIKTSNNWWSIIWGFWKVPGADTKPI